jgi:hypothetical protein
LKKQRGPLAIIFSARILQEFLAKNRRYCNNPSAINCSARKIDVIAITQQL